MPVPPSDPEAPLRLLRLPRPPAMHAPFRQIAALNKLVHEPARLAILTALSACQEADFLYLRRLTGLTKGNLSSHLSRLEEAGLVEVVKVFQGKKPFTHLRLTGAGQEAIEQHWEHLAHLRRDASAWAAKRLG